MKNLQCRPTRKRWLEIGVSVLLFALLIAWALVLEYTEPDREATAARKRFFAVARVTDILDDNAETQDWTEGRRIGQQYLEVEILNGPWKGETLETINYLTIYTNVDAKVGTKIVVRLDLDDAERIAEHLEIVETSVDAPQPDLTNGRGFRWIGGVG